MTETRVRRRRRAFSLVEVLVVAVLLSGGFLAILATLHGSRRGGAVTGRRLVARALLRNMRERFRLLPPERLAVLFGGADGGQRHLDDDETLDAPPWTAREIRRMGLRRSVRYGPCRQRPWLAILRCSVRYESFGGRELEFVARDVLPGVEGGDEAGRPAEILARVLAREPVASAGAGNARSSWIRRFRELDGEDGRLGLAWETLAAEGDARSLGRFLTGRGLPDGDYTMTHEALPGRVGAAVARLWILESADGERHLALWSRVLVDPLTGDLLADEAAGGEAVHFFGAASARILGLRSRRHEKDAWGLVVATERRVFVVEALDGEKLRLRLATLDEAWRAGGAEPWERALEGRLAAWSYGEDETRLPGKPRLAEIMSARGLVP